jgi:hypothetical protein
MNNVELIYDSLGFAFEILENLTGDLSQEQADWMPPGNANSIAALYWHIVAYVDQYVHEWCMAPYRQVAFEEWVDSKLTKRELGMGQDPLRHSWQEKVVITLPPENPKDPYWEIRASRESLQLYLPALHDYAQATKQAILSWVASLSPHDLERKVSTPIGEFNMGQVLETFIIGHINNHSGEISALRGCQGLKGYPW